MFAWLVFNHGNWNVIRDGFGFLPYIDAVVLFLISKDAFARLYEQNPKVPKWWRNFDGRTQKWLKINALLIGIAILAVNGIQEFSYAALYIASVLFGIVAGYYKRKSAAPINYTMILMLAVTMAIAMQPEFFRFGQLGKLGVIHLAALAVIVALAAVILVFRNFAPTGFIRDNYYRYIKWFMRLSCLLMLILFVMTEAVPALLGFGGAVAMTMWFAAKHGIEPVFQLSNNFWAMMLMMFGVITVMPLFTILGILCWKNNGTKAFWKNFYDVIK